MQSPIEVNFKDVRKTDTVESLIHEKVTKLERICGRIVSCRVTVEKTNHHQRTGSPFRVCVDMIVPPGHELIVKHKSTKGDLHDSLSNVLREVFSSAARQLKELMHRQRGKVKRHNQQQPTAFVSKVFPKRNNGFIKTINGHEVFFSKDSVLHDDFNRMEIGMGVRFIAELDEIGPRATTVEIIET
jgi:ribosome-associated translation inhibitor RaiA